ncbi:uncharacterized protein LOC143275963 [Babylonia areolata]|uniref:uncharacterized protein LOC143275963 n=1 Tax=Babylonia areolata TaxID=304850 RepID=UPI003FD60005
MAEDKDNLYFKRLLNMVPVQNIETDLGHSESNETVVDPKPPKNKKRKHQGSHDTQDTVTATDEKIQRKKESKQKKKKKEEKKATGSHVNIQEIQEKMRARIAELQAKRKQSNLTSAELQERKRLERKQRRLAGRKGKQKNKKEGGHKENGLSAPDLVSVKPPTKPVVTKEGKLVFSKFDFTKSGEKKKSAELAGKDYRRILARLEEREAKVAKLKETDSDAASRLEQKHVWQDVMDKAKGEKIKDDVTKVKKALKRKEKMKEQRKNKWKDRQTAVDKMKEKQQEKREQNIQKRQDDKKAKHRKKLIKKGRILPGF